MNEKYLRIFITVVAGLALLVLVLAGCDKDDDGALAVERGALLCATESGNCVESWNGSDLIGYSDAGSSQTWHIDGATGDGDFEGNFNIAGDLDLSAGITSTSGLLIDGGSDEVQLTVQGYTTQTNFAVVVETSAGNDLVTVDNSGNVVADGSGTFTGTVSAEQLTSSDDADIADDVRVDGTVSVTETVKAEHLRSTDDADVNDALTANSVVVTETIAYNSTMYPLGYATASYEFVCSSTTITGENQTVAVSGITTVTNGFAWLITDPGAGAGAPYMVTTDAPSGSDANLVVNVWQDDANAATSPATIGYCAIGNE